MALYGKKALLSCCLLILFTWSSLFCCSIHAADYRVVLTEDEQLWIAEHPEIRFSETHWSPLSIVEQGQFSGILADYFDEISASTGLNFVFIPSSTWPEALDKFENKQIDVLPGSGNSMFEQKLGLMSQSFMHYPLAIVTRDDSDFIDDLSQLAGKTITVPKSYTSHQYLKSHYPNLDLIITNSIEQSMALVSAGKADVFLAHLSVAIYNINSTFTNLKVSGVTEFEFQHHILVQDELQPLVPILNKALSVIGEQRKREIYDKWVKVQVETEVDYRIVYIILAISGLLLLGFFLTNWRLKYLVRERTNKLNKLLKVYSEHVIASETDENGITRYVSKAFCEISGYREKELLKLKHNMVRHPDTPDSLYENMWRTIRNGEVWAGEIKNRNKQGKDYWVYEVIRPEFDKNNQVSGYASIQQDITAHKEVESLSQEIEETQREVVFTMGAIGETRSKETGNHVRRVAEYAKLLSTRYGLDEREAEIIKQASPMHDIGKVAIPDSILNKPGKLTKEEFEIMKTHADLGYQMLKSSNRPILKAAALIAQQHHEKFDGTGYPQGLSGNNIHIYGRIIALADVFDALGSDRIYKKAWSDSEIFALLSEQKGKQFDPELIDIFFNHLPEFLAIREKFKDC